VALAATVGRPDAYAGELPIAYVTLKPGATATPDALKEWARTQISEPPAAPVEIVILDAMPVTAIGKIFKPTLRYDAIRRVYAAELEPMRSQGIGFDVAVETHETHGTLAVITVTKVPAGQCDAVRDRILEALGRYTVMADVRWADPEGKSPETGSIP
jgi:fatty-acyl-CoA synthase